MGQAYSCNFVPPAGHGVVISVYDMSHGCNARPPANVVQKPAHKGFFFIQPAAARGNVLCGAGLLLQAGLAAGAFPGVFFCRRLWYNKARSITSYARPAKRAACRATPKGGLLWNTPLPRWQRRRARAGLLWCAFRARGPTRWRPPCSGPWQRAAALQRQRATRPCWAFLKRAAGCATRWWPCVSARPKAIPARMW